MNIHESAEDYLETVLILKDRLGVVRSIDIVREKEFSKPSISVAMKKLRENGYIEMDAEGYITLLPPGEEIARRHLHPPPPAERVFGASGSQRGKRRGRCLQNGARHQRGDV